ncbi:SET domain-containing protein [Hyphococcus sp. DH-69]|uniref:SET domain-containing protein n=1 Tax=Hyphococcus formosus TaxID=3143534 RepID=UPI00398A958F
MMLVPTFVAASDVEGVGVFAAEPIKNGALIWRYEPDFDRLVPASWLNDQTPMMQDFLRKYAYPAHDRPDMLVIEIDNGRFMNHTLEPNTDFTKVVEGYAIRDIRAGDELLCNYHEFDPEFTLLPSLVASFSVQAAKPNGHIA